MKCFLFFLGLIVSTLCFTQVKLNFQTSDFNWNSDSTAYNSKDSFDVSILKMYVSNIELRKGEKLVFKEKNSFHLIDFSDTNSTSIVLSNKKLSFTSIRFQIGVDSSTTVSGAIGGELDPTKGMYWTWQTGYIHFKLEGSYNYSDKKDFVYHIGGFQYPNNTLRFIELQVNNTREIDVDFKLQKFIKDAEHLNVFNVMSPGKPAVDLVEILTNCFTIRK